jgi:outer membrane protein OmpA-like peptidoglycan-associated protein
VTVGARTLTAALVPTTIGLLLLACSGATTPDDPGAAVPPTAQAPEPTTEPGEDDDVESSATITGGDDVRTEAEIRVGRIISEYDGRETAAGTVLTIPAHVLFDFDDDQLRPDARAALDAITEVLEYYAAAPVEITGHTDSRGSASYNQDLSERRARSVVDDLVSAGIDPGRLTATGRGEADPVATNDSDEGRQANRRVEVLVRGVSPPDPDEAVPG